MSIQPAAQNDLPAIFQLLEMSGLPSDGLAEHIGSTLVVRAGSEITGCAALEVYAPYALLRSVAVAPAHRGRGLGIRLAHAALAAARQRGLTHVYLLTETAGDFFPRFGFRVIDRASVPPSVKQSVEFTMACCESALVMEMKIED